MMYKQIQVQVLPNRIQSLMDVWETKRWNVLKFKARVAGEDMVKVRAEYSEMIRYNPKDRRLAQLADRVIKYEMKATDARSKANCFYLLLLSKY